MRGKAAAPAPRAAEQYRLLPAPRQHRGGGPALMIEEPPISAPLLAAMREPPEPSRHRWPRIGERSGQARARRRGPRSVEAIRPMYSPPLASSARAGAMGLVGNRTAPSGAEAASTATAAPVTGWKPCASNL